MRSITFALILFSIASVSCNNSTTTTTETKTEAALPPAPAAQSKLNEDGTKKLTALVNDYYNLKDAFVATSATKADAAATQLITSTDSLKSYLQKNESKDDTLTLNNILRPYLDSISSEAKTMVATKDETCEKKRIPFSKISDQVYAIVKKAEIKNARIYQQHCPMAFDEKGASWLSDEADIKNPYYGKKMLECGDLTDSLK